MKIRKSISEKVITANRTNSAQSTGPTTETGKRRSRLNALKHGFYSRELRISEADLADFESLQSSLARQFAPASSLQAVAFEQVVVACWRCKLALRHEASSLDAQFGANAEPSPEPETPGANAVMSGWYAAGRGSLRDGLRFLEALRAEVAENGLLHIKSDGPWKESVLKGFGVEFYNELTQWEGLNAEAIRFAIAVDAHARNFHFPPVTTGGPEVVVDPKLQLEMITKLVDLQISHLRDLHRARGTASAAAARLPVDYCPRFFAACSREFREAVEWFLYLKKRKL